MGFAVKCDDSDFTRMGSCYYIDFDKRESALSGTGFFGADTVRLIESRLNWRFKLATTTTESHLKLSTVLQLQGYVTVSFSTHTRASL